jgi:hypothetical protein
MAACAITFFFRSIRLSEQYYQQSIDNLDYLSKSEQQIWIEQGRGCALGRFPRRNGESA